MLQDTNLSVPFRVNAISVLSLLCKHSQVTNQRIFQSVGGINALANCLKLKKNYLTKTMGLFCFFVFASSFFLFYKTTKIIPEMRSLMFIILVDQRKYMDNLFFFRKKEKLNVFEFNLISFTVEKCLYIRGKQKESVGILKVVWLFDFAFKFPWSYKNNVKLNFTP